MSRLECQWPELNKDAKRRYALPGLSWRQRAKSVLITGNAFIASAVLEERVLFHWIGSKDMSGVRGHLQKSPH